MSAGTLFFFWLAIFFLAFLLIAGGVFALIYGLARRAASKAQGRHKRESAPAPIRPVDYRYDPKQFRGRR